jgi:hypothetical protein
MSGEVSPPLSRKRATLGRYDDSLTIFFKDNVCFYFSCVSPCSKYLCFWFCTSANCLVTSFPSPSFRLFLQ